MSSIREKVAKLTPEKQEELKQYVTSIKEIKKKIAEMLSEADKVEEAGGPIPVDSMHLNPEE
jgi:ATP-dependent Zn protease